MNLSLCNDISLSKTSADISLCRCSHAHWCVCKCRIYVLERIWKDVGLSRIERCSDGSGGSSTEYRTQSVASHLPLTSGCWLSAPQVHPWYLDWIPSPKRRLNNWWFSGGMKQQIRRNIFIHSGWNCSQTISSYTSRSLTTSNRSITLL